MVQRQFTTVDGRPMRTLFNCFGRHAYMTLSDSPELTTLQIYAKTLKNFAPAKNEETSRFLADVRAHLESGCLSLNVKHEARTYERCWMKK